MEKEVAMVELVAVMSKKYSRPGQKQVPVVEKSVAAKKNFAAAWSKN